VRTRPDVAARPLTCCRARSSGKGYDYLHVATSTLVALLTRTPVREGAVG
jgi:hypothetical protein